MPTNQVTLPEFDQARLGIAANTPTCEEGVLVYDFEACLQLHMDKHNIRSIAEGTKSFQDTYLDRYYGLTSPIFVKRNS